MGVGGRGAAGLFRDTDTATLRLPWPLCAHLSAALGARTPTSWLDPLWAALLAGGWEVPGLTISNPRAWIPAMPEGGSTGKRTPPRPRLFPARLWSPFGAGLPRGCRLQGLDAG